MSIIKITDLSMKYDSNFVLNSINLDVKEGEIIGYIGPNGAGKSTTVKIMLGLVTGYTGKVEIFGENIALGNVGYKKRIGYVPEAAEIYDNLTAREYLSFIGGLYGLSDNDVDVKAKELMKLFDIYDFYDQRINTYSKGMRQKVVIISSLLHNPDLLFLDEPLSGLDANTVMVIKELLSLFSQKGKTIFYSSHIMEVVEKISNRIILINKGQNVADGSFENLKDQVHGSTLEQIFNELTGFNQHEDIAKNILAVIEG